MRTIFISSFHSLISRNILGAGLIERLLASGAHVVILCQERKVRFYEEEFARQGVCIAGISATLTWRDIALRALSFAAIRTRAMAIKRVTELRGRGRYVSWLLATRTGGAVLRFLARVSTPRGTYAEFFERFHPDLVLATDIQSDLDTRLVFDARRRGIPVVGMVRSWDNLTSKGLIRALPHTLVVHNDIIRREALSIQGVPEEHIRIVGIPHYDRYLEHIRVLADGARARAREKLMRSIGADPSRKLILFAPTGDRYISRDGMNEDDCAVLGLLEELMRDRAHIHVRFPLADTVRCLETRPPRSGTTLEQLDKQKFGSRRFVELTAEDDAHLMELLSAADLVVTGPSTIGVDAALFDTPVIYIAFDGERERPYYESVRRYYKYEQFAPVLASGGVTLARTREDFVTALESYLTARSADRSGRERLIREQVWRLDGKSTERLAAVLLEYL